MSGVRELAEVVPGGMGIGDGEKGLLNGEQAPVLEEGFHATRLVGAAPRDARCPYERPVPLERFAMPIVVAGRDLMGCAQSQTRSNKMAAFCFAVLSRSVAAAAPNGGREYGQGDRHRESFDCAATLRALIVTPTRELLLIKVMDSGFDLCLAERIRCYCISKKLST